MHSAGDFVVLTIVALFSSFAGTATGDNAIAVNAAAMKDGESTDVRQASAIKSLSRAASDISCASELTEIDHPRLT